MVVACCASKKENPDRTGRKPSAERRPDVGILVVDDEFSVRDSLSNWFRKDGYRVGAAENAAEALRHLQKAAWDIVLLDIRMPGMDGMELQRRIWKLLPDVVVIMITAFGSIDTAVQALKEGAYDYVTKPVDPEKLSRLVRRALEHLRLKTENGVLRERVDMMAAAERIVGESPQIKKALETVETVASSDVPVLIRGESGTGKETVARAIHAGGPRRYFPFVPVRCGALTETVVEREFFGYEKGAITGIGYAARGKFDETSGGTLFLDEVGSITPEFQAKLLSVLDTQEYTRIGAGRPAEADFRVISATHRGLEELVKSDRVRKRFFDRVGTVRIELPPLRHRRSDIPLLARHFLTKYASRMEKRITEIDPAAMDVLLSHDWPGNVRELANAIERALVVGSESSIRPVDLPLEITGRTPQVGRSLAEVEKAHIKRVLERHDWDMERAAKTLELDRSSLQSKIEEYQILR
jgi:DNA-binding NtrC family response regulator